jgi:diapolycopene oxygenase
MTQIANSKKKVLVVGAGAGGLASAVLLQNSGFQVTLIDKNERIGGKLNKEELNGYVFDTGPSILTLPTILKEIFERTGAKLEDYLELVNLDPQWRCFFNDGSHFDFRSGEEAMVEEISTFAPEDVDGYRKLMLKAREMYRVSEDNFFFRDLSNVWDVIKTGDSRGLDALKLILTIEPTKSYSDIVDRYIKNPQLRQALEHLPQYVGSSPFLSPAILACLIHVQFEKGCWYPIGGMNKISEALAQRFQELGGQIELNSEVEHVYFDGRSIRGFETKDGRLWTADEYVVNMDMNSLNSKMGRKVAEPSDLACSGVTVFLGLNKKTKNLAHHNFFFSKSHEAEFKDIYSRGLPHQDPTVYVCAPSITDSSVAPEGKENVFLLIHAPTVNSKTNWDTYLPEYVNLVEAKLARMGFDVEAHGVDVRQARSPKGIGEKWGTFKGNIYGMASHGRMAGGFKSGNASREFKNLQFAGGTVNPGAGVPMSLMSGMIAGTNLILKSQSLKDLRL